MTKSHSGPPAVAETVAVPPQVVPAFGAVAIVTPVGKMSMSGAVKVATLVLGLDSVMVRVDTPSILMVSGLKPLPSVGGPPGGTVGTTVKVTMVGRMLLPKLVCKALAGSVLR